MNKHIKINGVFTKENNQEITEQEQLDLLDSIIELCEIKGYNFGGGTTLSEEKAEQNIIEGRTGFPYHKLLEKYGKSKISDIRIDSLNSTLKISFDFDQTLSELPMQELAKKYIELGAEVYITTSRAEYKDGVQYDNSDLFEVADKLGIKRENITFTNYEDKYKFVKEYDLHFDDDEDEIYAINTFPSKCIGFLYQHNFNNLIVNF